MIQTLSLQPDVTWWAVFLWLSHWSFPYRSVVMLSVYCKCLLYITREMFCCCPGCTGQCIPWDHLTCVATNTKGNTVPSGVGRQRIWYPGTRRHCWRYMFSCLLLCCMMMYCLLWEHLTLAIAFVLSDNTICKGIYSPSCYYSQILYVLDTNFIYQIIHTYIFVTAGWIWVWVRVEFNSTKS
jgi:hypothetical protein